MSRITRFVLSALCLLTLAGAAAPALAQPPINPPGPIHLDLSALRLFRVVTVMGGGETETDAVNNALYKLSLDYVVLRSKVLDSDCPEYAVPPPFYDENDLPGEIEIETICWAEVRALVAVKAALTSP